jgi:hypothetical protein
VDLLEAGRSVLWTLTLNTRSDLRRLRTTRPDLADRINDVRTALDQPIAQG